MIKLEEELQINEDVNVLIDESPVEVKDDDKVKVKIEVKQLKNNLFRYEQINTNEETGESYGIIKVMKAQEFYMDHYAKIKAKISNLKIEIKNAQKMLKINEEAELKSRSFIARANKVMAEESEKSIKEKEEAIKEYQEKTNSIG